MNLRDKRILITGGTGFVGSEIANRLLYRDCNINIIANEREYLWRISKNNKCNFFFIDLRNFAEVKHCIEEIRPEIIFHLAGFINVERDLDLLNNIFSINFEGTRNLLLSLKDMDFDLFINTGTSDEYGSQDPPLNETFKEMPSSPYAVSKVASTYLCDMISRVFNKPIITVRPFLVYGPTQITISLIPSLIYCGLENKELLLTSCEQGRDFIYIDDLVDAYISLAENVDIIRNMGIFNLGSGEEIMIKDVVNFIKEKTGGSNFIIGSRRYRIGENMHHYCSREKINQAINWAPKWSIEEGLKETIKWWRNNREIWINYKYMWEK